MKKTEDYFDRAEAALPTTKCIKHGWGSVQICSLVFQITFGVVGQ